MTWAAERAKLGRHPVIVVELDLDACANVYGTAPCTATAARKCYNTYGTCLDKTHFTKTTKTLRFSSVLMDVSSDAIPSLQSVTYAPTRLDPAQGLGARASVTATFLDHTHNDAGQDPYLTTRGTNQLKRGTFWGRLLARNRYYQGRIMRVRTGYLVNGEYDASNFQTSIYIIERIEGPDAKGLVKVTAKDLLKLADDDRAKCPSVTAGLLTSAIAASGTGTFTVTGGKEGDYSTTGFLVAGDEILGFTRSGVTFTITSRAQFYTSASAHDIGEKIQEAYAVTTPTLAHDVIYDLLVNFAGVPSGYIDKTAWDAEAGTWLLDTEFTGVVTDPTGVNELITELAQHGTLYLWWNERTQKIDLRAIRPALHDEVKSLDDFSGFLEESTSVTEKPAERVSQVWVYYGLRNPIDGNKVENYRNLYVLADLEAESALEYGESRVKQFKSRWIPFSTPTQAATIANRYLKKYRDNPRYLKAQVDAKDADIWTGDVVRVSTERIQDVTGDAPTVNMQVIEAKEVMAGTKFELLLTDVYFAGRYFYVSPDAAPQFADATEEQKNTMGFITQNDGTMPDASEGYKII